MLVVPSVARLSVAQFQGKYRITVRGLLCAADLRRFERACSRALEQRTIALEVQLGSAGADESARVFLGRLRDRGAVILEPHINRAE